MDDRTFSEPVYVRTGEFLIQEVATLDDAFDFLDEWPHNLHGPAYQATYIACCRAYAKETSADIARRAMVSFAQSAMILEEVDALPPFPAIAKTGSGRGGASL